MNNNSSHSQVPANPAADPSPGLDGNSGKRFRKKRGAPYGNQNARKHGLYSKFLTQERIEKLNQTGDIKDLSQEIDIVRLKLDSLLSDPQASTNEVLKTVSILSKLIATQRRHFPAPAQFIFPPELMKLHPDFPKEFLDTILIPDPPFSQA